MQSQQYDSSDRLEHLDSDTVPSTRRCGGRERTEVDEGLQRYEEEEIVTKPWPPQLW
jgi:hypothetical protein